MQTSLHSLLMEAGLERYAETAERLALPSIRLISHPSPDESELSIGTTKLGGSPDLPPDFVWPRNGEIALAFIAQINLAEVAPFDVRHQLPPSGMLSFFYDYDYLFREGNAPNFDPALVCGPAANRVCFIDSPANHLRRTPMPEPRPASIGPVGPFRPCQLHALTEITIPDFNWVYIEALGLQSERVFLSSIPSADRDAYDAVFLHLLQYASGQMGY